MNLRDKVENFFEHHKQQVRVERLIRFFEIDKDDIDTLLDILYDLEREGKIIYDHYTYMHVPSDFCYYCGVLNISNSNQFYIKTKDNCVITIRDCLDAKVGDVVYVSKVSDKNAHPKRCLGRIERVVKREDIKKGDYIVKGVLKNDGNLFFVMVEDNRLYISKENLNTAFSGDVVNVLVGKNCNKVLKVLERKHLERVFRATMIDGCLRWLPIGPSYGVYEFDEVGFQEGDMIVASVNGRYLDFVRKLGPSHTVMDDVNALIIDFGFYRDFSDDVLNEAIKISSSVTSSDFLNRVDLRDLPTFTIDPVDAKDLDDAVSLVVSDGMYHLYVHTANPSHFIHLDSFVFKEALRRAFSIYPTSFVIPMLPDVFCNHLCSLNEDGDKLALTCKMDIDYQGNMVDFQIFKSIIRSDKQMDYDTVNRILMGDCDIEEYRPFYLIFYHMRELCSLLEKGKGMRGAISFENEEKEFVLDDDGNPVDIKEIQRGEAQNMIEDFMLLANETVACYAYYLDLPYIYRNHESPTVQKKVSLKRNLSQRGYFVQKIGNISHPVILQGFLNHLLKGKNKDERRFICEVVLKSMSRAFYDNQNIGHYGLALECYGTFTSPARKISDLLNHMVIEEFLDNGIASPKLEIYREFIGKICEYISLKQEDVDLLEKEINTLMLDCYSEKFIGEKCNARILFVNSFGIYVKDEHGLTGVIPRDRQMAIRNSVAVIGNREYHINEQINVILKEKKDNELIFSIYSRDKRLVKKKSE